MRETWVQSLGWEDPLENGWLPTPVSAETNTIFCKVAILQLKVNKLETNSDAFPVYLCNLVPFQPLQCNFLILAPSPVYRLIIVPVGRLRPLQSPYC